MVDLFFSKCPNIIKWVLKVKPKNNGGELKYKARLIVKGF
jgi:hypothetical protein